MAWMKTSLVDGGYISKEDPELFKIVDTPEEVQALVKKHATAANLLPD